MILETSYPIVNPAQLLFIMKNPNIFSFNYNFKLHASTSNTSPGLSIDSLMPIFDYSSLAGNYFLVALACYVVVPGATDSMISSMTGLIIILFLRVISKPLYIKS